MTDDGRTRIRLLGALEAVRDGEVLPVAGQVPRGVIARLALSAGSTVPTDELVADLWPSPTPAVVSSLRAHVSRLRAAGWRGLITGSRDGYRLEVDPADVDVLAYRGARTTEVGADRREGLERSEALWTGEPLSGLDAFPFVDAARRALVVLRADRLQELASALLDDGEEAAAARVAEDAGRYAPLREEPARLQAIALARSGRTADALAALDAFAARSERGGSGGGIAVLAALREGIVRQVPELVAPPASALGGVARTGVPIPLTRLVGRQAELERIATARRAARLVTLVGPAGVGKTRLAVEAAHRATPAVDEAQWLLDASAVRAEDELLRALAALTGAGGADPASIAARLGGRRGLLVIDNAEHVLGAVAALATALLSTCRGLTVVVTSREALRIAGERVVPVAPWAGDDLGDAERLFLDRAADVGTDPGSLAPAAVRRVCAALDGIPLAIELAAARLDVLDIDDLADDVRRDVDGPGSGRHASLAAAVGWSLRTLAPHERALLERLARFVGPFSRSAVAAVCEDDGDGLFALVRKSLVAVVADDLGERHYRLLQVVRDAVEPSGPDPAWSERHRRYAVAFAERVGAALHGPDARQAAAAIDASRHDLDAVLQEAIGAGDRRTAVAIAGRLAWHWHNRGLRADGIRTVERVLALAGPADADAECAALHALAFMAVVGDEPETLASAASRLLTAAARPGGEPWRPLAAAMGGYLAAVGGDQEAADALLEDAATDDVTWQAADAGMVAGDALRALGRPAAALAALQRADALATRIGHDWVLMGGRYVAGKTLLGVRRAREAVEVLQSGVARSMRAEDPSSALAAMLVLASACTGVERHRAAVTLYAAVEALGPRFAYSPGEPDIELARTYRARAAAALPREAWTEAHVAGAAMRMDDAARFATGIGR